MKSPVTTLYTLHLSVALLGSPHFCDHCGSFKNCPGFRRPEAPVTSLLMLSSISLKISRLLATDSIVSPCWVMYTLQSGWLLNSLTLLHPVLSEPGRQSRLPICRKLARSAGFAFGLQYRIAAVSSSAEMILYCC